MVPGSCMVSNFVLCARVIESLREEALVGGDQLLVLLWYRQKDLVDLKYSCLKVCGKDVC